MSRGVACKSATPQFENGITNGAAWYPLTGGMQVSHDFFLLFHCIEIRVHETICIFFFWSGLQLCVAWMLGDNIGSELL